MNFRGNKLFGESNCGPKKTLLRIISKISKLYQVILITFKVLSSWQFDLEKLSLWKMFPILVRLFSKFWRTSFIQLEQGPVFVWVKILMTSMLDSRKVTTPVKSPTHLHYQSDYEGRLWLSFEFGNLWKDNHCIKIIWISKYQIVIRNCISRCVLNDPKRSWTPVFVPGY